MTFFDSVSAALFMMFMVFVLLACVYLLIRFSSAAVRMVTEPKVRGSHSASTSKISTEVSNEKDEVQNAGEVFSSGEIKLVNVADETAAMVMAIVSDESGIPLSELCFKSIRLIEPAVEKENL